MTDADEVAACPECGTAEVRRCNPNAGNSPEGSTEDYRCSRCGARFDNPDYRESRHSQPPGNSPHGRALIDLDPGDFPPSGGDGVAE